MKSLQIKAGDSFDIMWSLPVEFGDLVDEIKCQARTQGGTLIEEFLVTNLSPTETQTRWRLYAGPSATTLWPLGTLFSDIKHYIDGEEVHTDTFAIDVLKSITV